MHSKPFYSIDFNKTIEYVGVSPFEWSQSLVLLAFKDQLKVGVLKFQEEYDDLEKEVEFEPITEYYYSPRVHAASWSPTASLNKVPKIIEFCVAGSDFTIKIFQANLSSNHNSKKEIEAHSDYINDCSYDYEGEYFASVSDDCTCKLWSSINFELVNTFSLTSPGMALSWHQDLVGKLVVGEKNGVIRLYNTITCQPLSTHYCYNIPLISLSWSPQSKLVAIMAAGELILMDIFSSNIVAESKVAHTGGGYKVAFCLANENYVASVGRPNSLKVTHVRNRQLLVTTSLQVYGGFSWHYRLPFLFVADNHHLKLFKVSPK